MCRSVWGRVIGELVRDGYMIRSICKPGKRELGSLVSWHIAGERENR